MAAGLDSLEECLERHLPPAELAEAKRILYGEAVRCAGTTNPSRLCVSSGEEGENEPPLPPQPSSTWRPPTVLDPGLLGVVVQNIRRAPG